MTSSKGKRVALVVGIVGALVILCFPFLFRDSLGRLLQSSSQEEKLPPLPRSPTGKRVDIVSGSIAVTEFSDFLKDSTGLPVIVDSEISANSITVSSTIKDVDAEIVRALLESNGFVLKRETLPNGREILRIRAAKNRE